jgi:hypothetical protein
MAFDNITNKPSTYYENVTKVGPNILIDIDNCVAEHVKKGYDFT